MAKLVGTEIRNDRDLRRFVFRVAVLSVAVALGFDVLNQLIFFSSWQESVRSWVITTGVALVISLPVGIAIARANLALYQAKEEVLELSRRDPLTGLLNRRALLDLSRTPPDFVALVIVDIDRFKRINDTYGHLVGDEVICAVAELMAAQLGEYGAVGRLGGEEFALLSSGISVDELMPRLWDFRDQIGGVPIVVAGAVVSLTISAGIARREYGQSFEEVYRAADRALYLAKAAGRNRVVLDQTVSPQSETEADDEDVQHPARRTFRGRLEG